MGSERHMEIVYERLTEQYKNKKDDKLKQIIHLLKEISSQLDKLKPKSELNTLLKNYKGEIIIDSEGNIKRSWDDLRKKVRGVAGLPNKPIKERFVLRDTKIGIGDFIIPDGVIIERVIDDSTFVIEDPYGTNYDFPPLKIGDKVEARRYTPHATSVIESIKGRVLFISGNTIGVKYSGGKLKVGEVLFRYKMISEHNREVLEPPINTGDVDDLVDLYDTYIKETKRDTSDYEIGYILGNGRDRILYGKDYPTFNGFINWMRER
jgi:hypothetical protein